MLYRSPYCAQLDSELFKTLCCSDLLVVVRRCRCPFMYFFLHLQKILALSKLPPVQLCLETTHNVFRQARRVQEEWRKRENVLEASWWIQIRLICLIRCSDLQPADQIHITTPHRISTYHVIYTVELQKQQFPLCTSYVYLMNTNSTKIRSTVGIDNVHRFERAINSVS